MGVDDPRSSGLLGAAAALLRRVILRKSAAFADQATRLLTPLLTTETGVDRVVMAEDRRKGLWRSAVRLFKRAYEDTDIGAIMRRSAAVAYYAALSLAPLLVIALALASLALDRETIRANVVGEVGSMLGPQGADLVGKILEDSSKEGAILATIVGLLTLLFGATAVFVELQDGLNAIWNVERAPYEGIWKFVRTRLLSAAMVVSFGFLLLLSLLVSTALSALTRRLHLGEVAVVGVIVHFLVAVLGCTFLFAMLFKFLPDVRIRWREVIVGAVITAVMFNVGQIAIGQYLGRSSVGSAYGAAGSLIVVLVWVYYSSAIFFFGAEVTQAYGSLFGPDGRKRQKKT